MKRSAPFITAKGISIRLNDRILFKNLDWEIRSDEHWAVIGPNGSGKSALIKVLCGALPIVKGEIAYDFVKNGKTGNSPEQIASVTFESQRSVLGAEAFYQERWNAGVNEDTKTVSEYLKEKDIKRISKFHIVGTYSGKDFERRRKEVVEKMELGELLKKEVVELSNGERRKVTIARALLKKPKLLILDNPFEGLDSRFRKEFKKILEGLMRGRMRLIIVATDRDELPKGITNILYLKNHSSVARSAGNVRGAKSPSFPRASALRRRRSAKSLHAVVEMQNVNVIYRGQKILKQINWTVKKGEKWALFGPNGAGKTTLLSLILADNPQAYGNKSKLFGRTRGTGESIWEIKKRIGWVSPELQLYYPSTLQYHSGQASSGQVPRDITALDVACSGWFDSIGLYKKCNKRQRSIALGWLKKLGLDGRSDSNFANLSEGHQRLALLARAMVKDPDLLILDEPCNGLDARHRRQFMRAVDSVCRAPEKTLIFVTHRADELPKCITHILKLKDGRIAGQSKKDS